MSKTIFSGRETKSFSIVTWRYVITSSPLTVMRWYQKCVFVLPWNQQVQVQRHAQNRLVRNNSGGIEGNLTDSADSCQTHVPRPASARRAVGLMALFLAPCFNCRWRLPSKTIVSAQKPSLLLPRFPGILLYCLAGSACVKVRLWAAIFELPRFRHRPKRITLPAGGALMLSPHGITWNLAFKSQRS